MNNELANFFHKRIFALLLSVTVMSLAYDNTVAEVKTVTIENEPEHFEEGALLLIYSREFQIHAGSQAPGAGTLPSDLQSVFLQAGVTRHELALPLLASNPEKWGEVFGRIFRIEFQNTAAQELAALLSGLPYFDVVEGVPLMFTQTTDPLYPQQSNAYSPQLKSSLAQAWLQATGNGIIIAIVDDAFEINHEEYGSRINYTWDVTSNSPNVAPNMAGMDHGNHVAGIAGAGLNGKGMIGVAYDATLQLIKATNVPKIVTQALAAYERAIASDPEVPGKLQPDIVNLSLGGYGSSIVWQNAVNAAFANGILTVAAAGNDAVITPLYPASYNNVLSVAAYTNVDQPTSFTCYGPTVDIAAPGQGILSLGVGATDAYSVKQGTSMASPFISGVAALVMEKHPNRSIQEIMDCITQTADAIAYPSSYPPNSFGSGRVNVVNAVACANVNFYLEVSFDKRLLCADQGTDVTITVAPFPGWQNYQFTYDFGDASAPVTTNNPSVTHTYPVANGSYTVTVTAVSAISNQPGYFSEIDAIKISQNCVGQYDRCWGRVMDGIFSHVAFDKRDDSIWAVVRKQSLPLLYKTHDAVDKGDQTKNTPGLINLCPEGSIKYSTNVPCENMTARYVVSDHYDSIYVAGVVYGMQSCGAQNPLAPGAYVPVNTNEEYTVLFKFDKRGNVKWIQKIGNERSLNVNGLAVAEDGKKLYLYTSAYNSGTPTAPPMKIINSLPPTSSSSYISCLNSSTGEINWSRQFNSWNSPGGLDYYKDTTSGEEFIYAALFTTGRINYATANSYQPNILNSINTSFIACLNGSESTATGGGQLLYATNFGVTDNRVNVKVNASGVFICGGLNVGSWIPTNSSSHHEFPLGSNNSIFLAKLNHDLSNLYWSSYIGTSAKSDTPELRICPVRGDAIAVIMTEATTLDFNDITPGAYLTNPPLTTEKILMQRFSSDGDFLEGSFLGSGNNFQGTFFDINYKGDIILRGGRADLSNQHNLKYSPGFQFTHRSPFLNSNLYSYIARFSYDGVCPQRYRPSAGFPVSVETDCKNSQATFSWQNFCGSPEGIFILEREISPGNWQSQAQVNRYGTPALNVSVPTGKSRWRIVFVPPDGRLGPADEGAADVISEEVEITCCAIGESDEVIVVCSDEPLDIGSALPPGHTVNWRDDDGVLPDTTDSITVPTNNRSDFAITKNYMRVVVDPTGCISMNRYEVIIKPLPAPTAPATVDFCLNRKGQLGASVHSGVQYSWTPAAWFDDPTAADPNFINTSVLGSYLVTRQVISECGIIENTVRVDVTHGDFRLNLPPVTRVDCATPTPMPFPEISQAPNYIIMLGHPGPGWTFEWSPATELDDPTAMQPNITATATRDYTLTVTTPQGCVYTAVTRVEVAPVQIPQPQPVLGICMGEVVEIDYSQPGVTDVQVLTTFPAQMVNVLSGNRISLTATSMGNNFVFLIFQTTCGPRHVMQRIFVEPPVVVRAPWQTVLSCGGQPVSLGSVTISASNKPNFTYSWSPTTGLDDPNSLNPRATVTEDTLYTITAVSDAGCVGSASVLVRAGQVPVADAGADVEFCGSQGTTQIGTPALPGHTYEWSGFLISDKFIAQPTVSPNFGSYKNKISIPYDLTVTGPDGCKSTSRMFITLNAGLKLAASANMVPYPSQNIPVITVCEGDVVEVRADVANATIGNYYWLGSGVNSSQTNGATYMWTAPTQSAAVTSQTHDVYVSINSIPGGCSGVFVKRIRVVRCCDENEVIADAGPDRQFCGSSRNIRLGTPALPGHTYEWIPSTGLDNPYDAMPLLQVTAAMPNEVFEYTLRVRNERGCVATDTVRITMNIDNPVELLDPSGFSVFPILAQPQPACAGEAVTLNAEVNVPGAVYMWLTPPHKQFNGQSSATFVLPPPHHSGPTLHTVIVLVSDPLTGCSRQLHKQYLISNCP